MMQQKILLLEEGFNNHILYHSGASILTIMLRRSLVLSLYPRVYGSVPQGPLQTTTLARHVEMVLLQHYLFVVVLRHSMFYAIATVC